MVKLSEDSINIVEKSERIKHDIEDCYRAAIKFLELYTNSSLRRAGNQKLFYIGFVSKFQSLYYFTRVDSNMKHEKTEEGKLLLKEVDEWLNNGVTKDPKKGIKLFTEYSQALFDKGILSFKR